MEHGLEHLRRLSLSLRTCVLLVGLATAWCPAGAADQASEIIIQEIQCRGNLSTSCTFISSNLFLRPGEPVNEEEIQSARLRLSSLPEFISADIHLEKGSQRGQAVVVIEVLEADRVENEFATGLSSRLSGVSQTIEGRITTHNVFGTRGTLNFDIEGIVPISGLQRRGIFSRLQFVDPKLLDSRKYFLIGGVSFQDSFSEYSNGDFYQTHQVGIDSSIGRRIFDYSYVTVGYLYRPDSHSISHYRGRAGVFNTDTDPTNYPTNRGVFFGYGWDSEDDPYFPTRGSRLNVSFGPSWANARLRKTWKFGTDSVWTVQIGGTPGTQYRSSFNESQLISVAYAHSISPRQGFGGIRQGRWYVEPGESYYGISSSGRTLAELGLKVGIRLDTKAFGMIDLYVFGSTSAQLKGGR
jgi:outer membrane protein assembly factor BamA